MTVMQGSLDPLFQRQTFGPRNGFEPLSWQSDIRDSYKESISDFLEDRRGDNGQPQHVYPFFAATATGKTKASALMACSLFNRGLIDQMFFCCPNVEILWKTKHDYLHFFGIDLVPLSFKDHLHGVQRGFQGALMTYPYLFKVWEREKRRIHLPAMFGGRTLVVFDEVHHLIEDESWGRATLAGFHSAPFAISMTGTPYNSKKGKFAFCNYEDTAGTAKSGLYRLRAEFNFSLGEAVGQGIVKKPHFVFAGRHEDKEKKGFEPTRVAIKYPTESGFVSREVTFDEALDDALSKLRLGGAVKPGSIPRKTFLKNALALCEEEGRRVAIFVGGDTKSDTTATEDAVKHLPAELAELGYPAEHIDVIVGGGKDSERRERVKAFRKSSKKILICINMLSEGVDIPELSAAIFLTIVTAKQTTIQRIGRALRKMDPHVTALIFMFADPTNLAIAKEIEDEIQAEEARIARRNQAERGSGGEPRYRRAEAIGISGGNLTAAIFSGEEERLAKYDEVRKILKEKRLPHTMAHIALELNGVTDVCR